jgi:hypothetical protein
MSNFLSGRTLAEWLCSRSAQKTKNVLLTAIRLSPHPPPSARRLLTPTSLARRFHPLLLLCWRSSPSRLPNPNNEEYLTNGTQSNASFEKQKSRKRGIPNTSSLTSRKVSIQSFQKKNPLAPSIGSTMDPARHASTASVTSFQFSPLSTLKLQKGDITVWFVHASMVSLMQLWVHWFLLFTSFSLLKFDLWRLVSNWL